MVGSEGLRPLPSFGSVRRWLSARLVIASVAGAGFVALAAFAGRWPTTLLVLLAGGLTVAMPAVAHRFPRLEVHLARWLLAASVIALGAFAVALYPEGAEPQDQVDHSQGLVMLGLASLVASGVLALRGVGKREPARALHGVGIALLLLNVLFLLVASVVLSPDCGAH